MRTLVACAAALIGTTAGADVIYGTEDPFGGPFGLIGFDVGDCQSVGVRFMPDANYALDAVSVWFMSNDFSGQTHPLVTLTVRAGDESMPSGAVLETLAFEVSAVGWDPQLESVQSVARPILVAGAHYWIACESLAPCGLDGVWNWAHPDVGFVSTDDGADGTWQPGGSGAVPATIVEGTPLAPGDLNGDGAVDVDDLLILLGAWGACTAPCVADLDGDGDVDVDDLLALLAAWGG